jgi:hypothetical protein
VQFVALDDLDRPMAVAGSGSRDAWSLVAGIGEDALDEGEETAGASIETNCAPSRSANVGWMDYDVKDVALAPDDLLAGVKPLRVKRAAPF